MKTLYAPLITSQQNFQYVTGSLYYSFHKNITILLGLQDTFFQLIKSGPAFESEEHEKAWLIRTATNICKNVLRHWWRRHENIEDFYNLPNSEKIETDDIFKVVMELPEKYKTVVYLYYYEGYTSVEIAGILKKPQSTIRNYLHEARAILKERLGDDFDEEQ